MLQPCHWRRCLERPPNLSQAWFGRWPRLTSELRQLWSDFAKNYPAEVSQGDTLVQLIFGQKAANEIRFIPWRQILGAVEVVPVAH